MTSGRRGRAAALLGTLLAACAPTAPPTGAGIGTATGSAVTVREDLSGRYLALIGPPAQHDAPYLDTPQTNFFCLRSFIDQKTGASAHQLYVASSYDAKRDWDAAHDGAGQKLRFIPISRYKIACNRNDNCSYAEEFAAAIPESELRQNPGGLSVTFTDPAGDAQTIAVSSGQISAQLAALGQRQKRPPDTAVAH
jgi:hypothetical protein